MRSIVLANSGRSAGRNVLLSPLMRRLCQSCMGVRRFDEMFSAEGAGKISRVWNFTAEVSKICSSIGCLPFQVIIAIGILDIHFLFQIHRFLQLRSLVSLLPTVSSDARNYLWSAGLKGSICNGTVALSFGLMVESQAHSTKEKIGDTIIMHL